MKYLKKCAPLLAVVLGCAVLLAGCTDKSGGSGTSSNNNGIIIVANSPDEVAGNTANLTPLAEVKDFTFDFETMQYSFTGADGAEFYFIRVYPVENGQQSNLASFQSDKINAEENNSYSGTVENQTLLAGDYIAYVIASGSGYSSSETSYSGKSTQMASPSVSANWNTGESSNNGGWTGGEVGNTGPEGDETEEEEPGVSIDITITAGDSIAETYTLLVTNELGSEVYRDDAATTAPINLTASDVGAEELSTEDVYTVTVYVNEVAGYKVPANPVSVQVTEKMSWGFPF